MQRVLMTEPIAAQGVQELRSYPAIEVVERHGLTTDELRRAVASCAGLLVRSQTDVSRALIEAATELRVIGRAGAGVDNIDVAAATERGVLVMNTPGANAQAAAELTVGLLFAVARHIAAADASVKAGQWERTRFRGTQLLGKTLGIVGIGNVGRLVARSAAALGMHVVAHDPYVRPRPGRRAPRIAGRPRRRARALRLHHRAHAVDLHLARADRRARDSAHEARRLPAQLFARRRDRRAGPAGRARQRPGRRRGARTCSPPNRRSAWRSRATRG